MTDAERVREQLPWLSDESVEAIAAVIEMTRDRVARDNNVAGQHT